MSRFTKPAPKPESRHSSIIKFEGVIRRIAQTAEFATSASHADILQLAFSSEDEKLAKQIDAVKKSHKRHGIIGATIEVALTRQGKRSKIEARIITGALRKDQGGF